MMDMGLTKPNWQEARPVWIGGEKFYWHDEILKFIDACAGAPPPPKNANLRNRVRP